MGNGHLVSALERRTEIAVDIPYVGAEILITRTHRAGFTDPETLAVIARNQPRRRISVVVVLQVHLHRQPDLLEVAAAHGATTLFLGAAQRGQQDRRQNRDDRDDDEKLDEGESGVTRDP